MGKRSNPAVIELNVVVGEGFQVHSSSANKRRQVLVSSRVAAIALLSIRDSAELVVPAVVDSKLPQQQKPAIKKDAHASYGEFTSVTDDENDDGHHYPTPQVVKSKSCTTCHEPPPIACALRQPALALGGPKTHTTQVQATTGLIPLGKPLRAPPSLAPHLMAKVQPINLVGLS